MSKFWLEGCFDVVKMLVNFENGFGHLPTFSLKIGQFFRFWGTVFGRFLVNFWPFAHFLPTFEKWIWPRKMPILCGFAGFLVIFPLFFLIKCEEKK